MLADVLWGPKPASLRRLRALVTNLPSEAAFIKAAVPGVSWTQQHELLATLIEVTDRVHLRHLSALGAKRLPKGITITRPGAPKPAKRKATSEDLRRIFGGAIRYASAEAGKQ